jgi:SAM-dependent methyltransferase
MATSLVYRSALLYESVMLALYRRHYFARCRVVADLIEPGRTVVDVCCGPGNLYRRYLKPKGIQYLGLDLNPCFVARVKAAGGEAQVWDLYQDRDLPKADIVIMQASLYHFLPEPSPIVDRMVRAARLRVIIAEPIRNLSDSHIGWLANFARRQSDAGKGGQNHRFNEQSLDLFFQAYQSHITQSFPIPGGREKVYVLTP